MEKPLVSVRFMVYNNEPYIREAVESILMQQTNFKVEVVVGDDFSTDATLDIIKSYNNTENIYFKILDRPIGGTYWRDRQKLGRLHNFVNIIDNCQGKYIAMLDGDDYWTHPLKLQNQVEFLENNQDINICFHKANLLKNNKFELHVIPKDFNNKPFYYVELLRYYNFISTASVVLRVSEHFKLPNWFNKITFGDLGLYKVISDSKKIRCLDEVMSVYRIHDQGIWSKLNKEQIEINYLNFFKTIMPFLNTVEKEVVNTKIDTRLKKLSKLKYPKYRFLQLICYVNLKIKYS